LSGGLHGKSHDGHRLVAVVYADMVGYSRLIAIDDVGTIARLRTLRQELIDPALEEHGGTIVQTGGDSLLIVFDSINGAVRAAIKVQTAVPGYDADQPPDRHIRFRVGINIGDAIAVDTDLHGDAINITARLQAACPPGGICVTRAVRDHAQDRLDLVFEGLGVLQLKNIPRPVEAYVLRLDQTAERAGLGTSTAVSRVRFPEFGGQPAIAVLPFQNHAAEDDPFADGLTEDVIAALSRWRDFPVISRASVFAFKGKEIDLNQVGRQLGARYVTEGTLRRRGDRVRVTAQLADVVTGENLFTEHYDHDVTHLLEMQDEIVHTIVGSIEPELLRHERERVIRAHAHNPSAYELLQRGQWHHYRYTAPDNLQARAFFRNALAIDPDYGRAAAALSIALTHAVQASWESDPAAANEEARALARQAVKTDPRDPQAHLALGAALYRVGRTEEAVASLQAAIRLNPSYAPAHANLAFAYNYLNRPNDAQAAAELALRLSPHDPRRFVWLPALAASHYLARRYTAALRVGHEALAVNPNYLPVARYIVAALGQLGQREAAKGIMPLLRNLDGDLAGTEAHLLQYYVIPAAVAHVVEGLRKAGYS